jgi:hypothetical protein
MGLSYLNAINARRLSSLTLLLIKERLVAWTLCVSCIYVQFSFSLKSTRFSQKRWANFVPRFPARELSVQYCKEKPGVGGRRNCESDRAKINLISGRRESGRIGDFSLDGCLLPGYGSPLLIFL